VIKPFVVKDLFSKNTFNQIRDLVVDYGRNIHGQFDPEFNRTSVHNFSPLVDVHFHLTEFASEIFKASLKPSYVFMSNYLDGGICPVHRDRPQCFRTIDLMVEQESDIPWEIRISDPLSDDQWENYKGLEFFNSDPLNPDRVENEFDITWNSFYLNPNQAVCYSGTHSWHYRPKPSSGRSDLIFFHFVEEGYSGDLD
jgi:hypothetical protein